MTRFIAILLLVVAALLPAVALAQDDNSSVSIQDNQFSPQSLEVPAGTTVTWTHTGGTQHTVTADDSSFDSRSLNPGDSFTFTFTSPGTYAYYCAFHGGPGGVGMSATIVVT